MVPSVTNTYKKMDRLTSLSLPPINMQGMNLATITPIKMQGMNLATVTPINMQGWNELEIVNTLHYNKY